METGAPAQKGGRRQDTLIRVAVAWTILAAPKVASSKADSIGIWTL